MNMIVSAAALTAGSKAIASVQPNDSVLLEMEEKIFEYRTAAKAYDDEISRLHDICVAEAKRLHLESLTGRCTLTADERSDKVGEMPESKERVRLVDLQDIQWIEHDTLIDKMWATPAHGPEGRRAKLLVLLGCIMPDEWRETDDRLGYELLRTRSLLIEFVGGEPGEQLRDQFAA